MWVRHNSVLYDLFQVNQPGFQVNERPRKKSGLYSCENKTYDQRNMKIKAHRRTLSSYDTRDENASIIIGTKVVTKNEIIALKKRFCEIYHSETYSIQSLLRMLNDSGYQTNGLGLLFQGKPLTFPLLLETLYKKATKNQFLRLMKFAGESVSGLLKVEKEKQRLMRMSKNQRLLSIYQSMFNKYDLNKDGKIDLKELKLALNQSMTEKGIEKLFESYKNQRSGISLVDFIKMYAPEGVDVQECLQTSFCS
jgi:hypothetical protein